MHRVSDMFNLDILTNLVDEAGLSNVGVATEKQSSGVGVDSRQARKMLTDCDNRGEKETHDLISTAI